VQPNPGYYQAQPHPYPSPPPFPQRPPPPKRDPEKTKRTIGLVLYVLGMLGGLALLVLVFLLPPLFEDDPVFEYQAMALGAMLALPPLLVYLWVPWIVDRYDPEPLWALLAVLAWGAIAACGFSAVINTSVHGMGDAMFGRGAGSVLGACVSAPLVEEAFKGLGVAGMYWFVRREFDGVVDGVIYAAFAALGFAAVENIIYYGDAARDEVITGQEGLLVGTVVIRGILAPWGHPLYTSMTGLGFGIARETDKPWLRWAAPIGGYLCAAFLHSVWNTSATLSNMLLFLMLPLWLLFVLGFAGLVLWLVSRKGRIIRQHLEDEVLMGTMTVQEVDLVCSPFASWKATFSWGGAPARKFVAAAARLALSKWHTGRAARSRSATVSADFVIPLRQELGQLRAQMERALGRALPRPQPWKPGQQAPFRQVAPPWWMQRR
jgi:RsiW-degrading membrane proteinase PrsW (M82 family)